MNVTDRGFLYVGVVAIGLLAGTAIFQTFQASKELEASRLNNKGKLIGAPAEQIFIGTLDSKLCYVSDSLPELYSVPDPNVPHSIYWTAIGNDHPYTITFTGDTPFASGDKTVAVPAGGSSVPQFIAAKPGNFAYTVQNDKTSCTGTITGFTAAPVWVHVSK
jgi:hypothetical protein